MRKLKKARDISGRDIRLGDTVTTLAGDVTGKVYDIGRESDILFVRVRPLHQVYGQGIWHAADRMVWLSASRRKKKQPQQKTQPGRPQRKMQRSGR